MSLKTRAFQTRSLSVLLLSAAALLIAGCAKDENMAAIYIERPIEQIYNDAWVQVNRENWLEAGRQFDEVERQHPYSIWARRAILMSAYCYYAGNRYTESIDAANRFIQLHPGNRDVPYAYYLKAVSLYEQINDVERDQAQDRRGADRAAGSDPALPQYRICARRAAEDRSRRATTWRARR